MITFGKLCHRIGLTECSCIDYMLIELAHYSSNFVLWDGSGNHPLIWRLPFVPAWKERMMSEMVVDRQ